MQGQFTCDLNEVSTQQSQLGAHCTPKGRMMGNFRLAMRAENDYLLALPDDNCTPLLAHINKYIVFSKAEASRSEDNYLAFGISGEKAVELVQSQFGSCPVSSGEQVVSELGICIRLSGEAPRFEAWINAAAAEAFWLQSSENVAVISTADWTLADIRNGLVEIHAATADDMIPQSIGLQHLDGVSFSKGCYTGQEIVARTRYLGKLKRQLFHFTAPSFPPVAGDDISVADSGQNAGVVVAAVSTSADSCEGLAVINQKTTDKPLQLATDQAATISVTPSFDLED
jgi:folate-binding protein YgfZ